ncbi:hypothetical protein [Mariprofundus sp. NF]|uniref:hypothetical protein n=1 Tax=Mariprofundus sp. NF TaxID=2608716 RepID=UPI0015A18DC8|nr:hypothetical protein [Mariprofundus sp. NF]
MSSNTVAIQTTDIDAVLLKISENSITLELFEAKNYKKKRENSAAKELRELLVPVLNGKGSYRVTKVKGYGAKLVLKCTA